MSVYVGQTPFRVFWLTRCPCRPSFPFPGISEPGELGSGHPQPPYSCGWWSWCVDTLVPSPLTWTQFECVLHLSSCNFWG